MNPKVISQPLGFFEKYYLIKSINCNIHSMKNHVYSFKNQLLLIKKALVNKLHDSTLERT